MKKIEKIKVLAGIGAALELRFAIKEEDINLEELESKSSICWMDGTSPPVYKYYSEWDFIMLHLMLGDNKGGFMSKLDEVFPNVLLLDSDMFIGLCAEIAPLKTKKRSKQK